MGAIAVARRAMAAALVVTLGTSPLCHDKGTIVAGRQCRIPQPHGRYQRWFGPPKQMAAAAATIWELGSVSSRRRHRNLSSRHVPQHDQRPRRICAGSRCEWLWL